MILASKRRASRDLLVPGSGEEGRGFATCHQLQSLEGLLSHLQVRSTVSITTLVHPACWRGVSGRWGTAGGAGTAAAGEPFSQGEPAADFSILLSRPFVLIPQSTKGIEQGWEYV